MFVELMCVELAELQLLRMIVSLLRLISLSLLRLIAWGGCFVSLSREIALFDCVV